MNACMCESIRVCVIGDCECVHVCMEYGHLGPVQILRESILLF